MSHRFLGFAVSLPVTIGALALPIACRPSGEPPTIPSADRAPAQPAVAVPGIDFGGIDRAVLPGDDFFAFANGGWAKRTEIPRDRADWGIGAELTEKTNLRLKALLESAGQSAATGAEPRKVADFYATFMDEASIEAKGIAPLQLELERVAAIPDRVELARELGRSLRADVDPLNNTNFHTDRLFGLWVSPAFAAPERNQAYLLQGGLGLPDRDYYVAATPRMAEIRARYLAHITKIFELAGISDATGKAAHILALETKMAKVHLSREDSTEVLRANNPWGRDDFSKRAPGLDWHAFFAAAGLERARVITVWQPAAIAGLAALCAAEPLSDWKDWLTFHAIDRRSPLLPKAFVEEDFSFYHRTLYGTPQIRERWKRGVALANDALGDAVGQLYVARYFPPASKAALQAMVQDIVEAFSKRIDRLAWMAPSTRAVAKRKLATLYVGVGYPDHWIDYAPLDVVRGDAVGNAERAELFLYRRSLAKLDAPVDKTEWWMVAQIVNAVNLPMQNALNFPAAILVPPFFDPAAPAAVNYGSIGATIGHEISHSFDDQGAQFDPDGKLADWWTKADREHFQASGAQLVAQYDAYRPFPDLHVNGKLTLGENIADLAGLAAAHDAWLASLQGQPAPVLGGLTGEQQFFLAYAQGWRSKQREPSLRQQLITDGHAPDEYRADTVRNIDGWYGAFDVTPSQALYLAPEQRVNVW